SLGARELLGEIADGAVRRRLVEVPPFHHGEAESLELRRHVARVVLWVLQARGVLVGRVADDEGHALRGLRRRAGDDGARAPHRSQQAQGNSHDAPRKALNVANQRVRIMPYRSVAANGVVAWPFRPGWPMRYMNAGKPYS